ncbi:WD40-repeat-containing domain protein, partial [Polychytrium aggregatum]|uniref:WD40-repeat-containing domain protein n=1 Tax=Polychytrium aggregatum TaxID=110093 RepID=UPI0022FEC890
MAPQTTLAHSDSPAGDKVEDFRIIAGTYERLLYGIDAFWTDAGSSHQPASETSQEAPAPPAPITLTPVFIYPSHITCIKCLATTGRFLATGSTDEHIKLYDLQIRKEIGSLMHHNGSITCLKFFKKSHLIAASEDGTISIVRTRDWELLSTLKGHRGAVDWIDIHPSGKVLLSVARDGLLKVWDMAKAVCAHSTKLPKPAERVCWSPDGDYHAVLMDRVVQISDVDSGEVVGKIEGIGKITTLAFVRLGDAAGALGEGVDATSQVVLTGGEDKTVGVWSLQGRCLARWDTGHGFRVKDLHALEGSPDSGVARPTVIVTCSSDGGIRLWN